MKDKEAACDECGTLTKNIMRRKILVLNSRVRNHSFSCKSNLHELSFRSISFIHNPFVPAEV